MEGALQCVKADFVPAVSMRDEAVSIRDEAEQLKYGGSVVLMHLFSDR